MKKVLCAVIMCAISLQANAGFWDTITDFFSGSDNDAVAAEQSGPQLVPLLVQQLGVTGQQASGGMGALIQAAKVFLSGTEYAALVQAIPNIDTLLAAAPAQQSPKFDSDLLSSAVALASEYSQTAKTAAQLLSQFQSLGLSAEMIPKFADITDLYLQQTENADAGSLLNKALANIL